jgi:hypothetical protein
MSFFKTAQYCAFDGKIVFGLKNFPKKLVVTMTVANREFKKVVLNQPRQIYKLSSFKNLKLLKQEICFAALFC